ALRPRSSPLARRRNNSMSEFIAAHGLLLLAVLAAGLASGFAGGLFGIGGGIVTVPALYAIFRSFGAADGPSLKSAIGTSLAVIIVTSLRAVATHREAGQVDAAVLKSWTPWIALGAAAGGLLARYVSGESLAVVFIIGALFIGWRRVFARSNIEGATQGRDLTGSALRIPVGIGTGLFSALMGLGGGALGVIVMRWSGRTMHQAVGTASGFGVAVAAPGALTFLVSGLGHQGLPPLSLGFINLPAFALMAATSAFSAPIGARVAHRVKGPLLSQLFGLYILIAAAGLLWDMFAK
ncbi:MAG TPA: sulfite exporter TauE/SafE family protein, partial [Parvularculaceae bacterium]|nr:sulfite exporter TauE/SafE family protein [Parvularculaceae bacterium]